MITKVILPALLGAGLILASSFMPTDILFGYQLSGDAALLALGMQIAGAVMCGCAIANVVSGNVHSKEE